MKPHKDVFCAATIQWSLIEEHFPVSLIKESQIFTPVPQNKRARPSYLFSLMFDSHTARNPSHKMKRFLFLPFFLILSALIEKSLTLVLLTCTTLMAITLCTFVDVLKALREMCLCTNIHQCGFLSLFFVQIIT